MVEKKDGMKSTRREAIKRLGLLGAGAALIPAASRGQLRPLAETCYESCVPVYTSVNYYASMDEYGTYNSINVVEPFCYGSCHNSYASYTSEG